jgi:CubicO group peptidase (beta-lactamase class C family)
MDESPWRCVPPRKYPFVTTSAEGAVIMTLEAVVGRGLMQGFPPGIEDRVTTKNMLVAPYNRWAFQHMRELVPTREVSRGLRPVQRFEEAPVDLSGVTFLGQAGVRLTLAEMLDVTEADALVILHDGRLVYETYRTGMQPGSPHQMMSVTKSFVGTLAEQLAHEGLLDTNAPVTDYLPELAGSAWDTALVRHALDMTTGIRFSEIYDDPTSEIGPYAIATGLATTPDAYAGARCLVDLLPAFVPEGEHGPRFHYVTPNTDVVGWIVARAAGKSLSRLLSERIWSRLGMESDAYIIVDSVGMEIAGAGLNASARDLARFGQLILDDGQHAGEQLIAPEVIARIQAGGERGAFAQSEEGEAGSPTEGWSYRSFWWVSHNDHGAFTAIGINGQWLWIDPSARMVAVLQSSHPEAVNLDADFAVVNGLGAVARHLMRDRV